MLHVEPSSSSSRSSTTRVGCSPHSATSRRPNTKSCDGDHPWRPREQVRRIGSTPPRTPRKRRMVGWLPRLDYHSMRSDIHMLWALPAAGAVALGRHEGEGQECGQTRVTSSEVAQQLKLADQEGWHLFILASLELSNQRRPRTTMAEGRMAVRAMSGPYHPDLPPGKESQTNSQGAKDRGSARSRGSTRA
jgi:hypothetical protein